MSDAVKHGWSLVICKHYVSLVVTCLECQVIGVYDWLYKGCLMNDLLALII